MGNGGDQQGDKSSEDRAALLSKWRIESYLPSMRLIVFFVGLTSLLIFGIYPLVSDRFAMWNSGEISNAHSLIAHDCKKCHSVPFKRVEDAACLSCHNLSEHSKDMSVFTAQHIELKMSCSKCHMEHNGDHGLLLKDSDFCVDCHAKMSDLKPNPSVLNVASLAEHPPFRASLPRADRNQIGVDQGVLPDDRNWVNRGRIKVNHAVHLRDGLRGKDGNRVKLDCGSCHELDTASKRIKPVRFEKHCGDCHALGFDPQFPDARVPHGDAERVYPAIWSEYAKLLAPDLSKLNDISPGSESPERILPGRDSTPTADQSKAVQVNTESLTKLAREAELDIFTRTGCFLCHSYSEKSKSEQTPTNTHFSIDASLASSSWMPRANFSHGAHEEFSCESCHAMSTDLELNRDRQPFDIQLPDIKRCQECHADSATPGYVESGCGQCHMYHEARSFPAVKKHSIDRYLRELTRASSGH